MLVLLFITGDHNWRNPIKYSINKIRTDLGPSNGILATQFIQQKLRIINPIGFRVS